MALACRLRFEIAGGSFRLHPHFLLLASLNRPLFADKVRNDSGHSRVEAHHVHHAAVVRVVEGEAIGGRTYNDRLRVTDELAAILTQRLRRMNVARPLSLGVYHLAGWIFLFGQNRDNQSGDVFGSIDFAVL